MKKMRLLLPVLLMAQDDFGGGSIGGGWTGPSFAPSAPIALTAEPEPTAPPAPVEVQINTLLAAPNAPQEFAALNSDSLKTALRSLLLGQTDPASAQAAISAEIVKVLTFAENEAVSHLPALARVIAGQALHTLQTAQQQIADQIAARIISAITN